MIANEQGTFLQEGDKVTVGKYAEVFKFIKYSPEDADLCVLEDSNGKLCHYRRYMVKPVIQEIQEDKFQEGDKVNILYREGEYTFIKYLDDVTCELIKNDVLAYASKYQIKPAVTNETEDYGKHYKYEYKGIKLDPYRILSVYNVTDPAMQHAIKKLLRAGNSIKDLEQDIKEVIQTLERKLEMMKEDASIPDNMKEDTSA